jgi:hypothetical protein
MHPRHWDLLPPRLIAIAGQLGNHCYGKDTLHLVSGRNNFLPAAGTISDCQDRLHEGRGISV